MADWYYIGHYGQLGPLTREQIDELIDGGVIARDTFVWSTGMAEWQPADRISEKKVARLFRVFRLHAGAPGESADFFERPRGAVGCADARRP